MKNKILKYTFVIVSLVCFSYPASASTIDVQKGDSMWLIANRYKVKFGDVLKLNTHHQNPHLIHIGDRVNIPAGSNGTSTTTQSSNDSIATENKQADYGGVSQLEQSVFQLVNQERKKNGLEELTLSTKLTSLAKMKANDMATNGYFSHTSPTYGTPFQMLQSYGISYKSAGENIAAGQKSAKEVMQSWMNSSGHRANILNSGFTEIGIGYVAKGSYGSEWVQLFIGK